MKIFIKLNVSILSHPMNTILRLDADDKGTATNQFWRRRIEDSKTDSCITLLKKKPKGSFLNG